MYLTFCHRGYAAFRTEVRVALVVVSHITHHLPVDVDGGTCFCCAAMQCRSMLTAALVSVVRRCTANMVRACISSYNVL